MLTPEQVREIRRHWNVDGESHVAQLLADRAEIAAELERIRHNTATLWPWSVTLEAITQLAEKLK